MTVTVPLRWKYNQTIFTFWWSLRSCLSWNISKGALEWDLYQPILYSKEAFYYGKPESDVQLIRKVSTQRKVVK